MQKRALQSDRSARYRLVVGGCVGRGWSEWFGADRVTAGSDTTEITLWVADQSELFGRLQRVQDLNLEILALSLLSAGGGPSPLVGSPGAAAHPVGDGRTKEMNP